jgi:hypothetical protein
MIINSNYRDKNKDFSFKNETVQKLFVELDKLPNRSGSLSNFIKFQFECEATDILQKLVDFCNNNVLSNFNLELKMVE